MDRKGNISVVVLALITVFLICIALTTFYLNGKKVSAEVINVNVMDRIYSMETKNKYQSYEVARETFLTNYEDAYSKTSNPSEARDFVNQRFSESKVDEKIIEDAVVVNNDNRDVSIGNGPENKVKEIEMNFDGQMIKITGQLNAISGALYDNKGKKKWIWEYLKYTPIVNDKMILGVIHRPALNISINVTKFGVHDFDEIYESTGECSKLAVIEEIETCMKKKLYNFDIVVGKEADNSITVRMSTKRQYLIGGSVRKITLKKVLTQGL